jgi:hypothetical protein
MPDIMYGNKVKFQAHVSDLVRFNAVYSEGGEYFEGCIHYGWVRAGGI